MIIIDTDILIWFLRGDTQYIAKFTELGKKVNSAFFITPIQIAEIYTGLRENERTQTTLFLQEFHHIDLDQQIGELAGDYMRQYKKSHHVMMADALIAAATTKHALTLWTQNKKHYPMLLPGQMI